jgi:hypothetical protein
MYFATIYTYIYFNSKSVQEWWHTPVYASYFGGRDGRLWFETCLGKKVSRLYLKKQAGPVHETWLK